MIHPTHAKLANTSRRRAGDRPTASCSARSAVIDALHHVEHLKRSGFPLQESFEIH